MKLCHLHLYFHLLALLGLLLLWSHWFHLSWPPGQVLDMQKMAMPTTIRQVQPISKLQLWVAEVHYPKTTVPQVLTDAINEIAGCHIITNANIGTLLHWGTPRIKAALDAHTLVIDNLANTGFINLLCLGEMLRDGNHTHVARQTITAETICKPMLLKVQICLCLKAVLDFIGGE
ncbi:hypothetical protein DFH08DRAFT_806094 [Mycena albidolilacea]|uniref:Uncharacterized protein n=1 Tax=Mycena albidolilacea TaxID=1033008 RepID=A0AAD7A8I0_9AGAR|nr:hypothetical protein DFH08DRAFT_806094 [Mycena albidolilacea]